MLLLLVSCPDAKLMGLQPGYTHPSFPIIFPPFLAHPHHPIRPSDSCTLGIAFWMVDRALERETENQKPYSVPMLQGDLEQMVKEF